VMKRRLILLTALLLCPAAAEAAANRNGVNGNEDHPCIAELQPRVSSPEKPGTVLPQSRCQMPESKADQDPAGSSSRENIRYTRENPSGKGIGGPSPDPSPEGAATGRESTSTPRQHKVTPVEQSPGDPGSEERQPERAAGASPDNRQAPPLPGQGMIIRISELTGSYLHLNLTRYKSEEVRFRLCDVTGSLVKTYAGYSETGSFSLDIADLSSGMYLLNVVPSPNQNPLPEGTSAAPPAEAQQP